MLDADPDSIEVVLEELRSKKRLRMTDDGLYQVTLGRVTRRTTLTPKLWPALLAGDRLYSIQEIATLRTAIPMLQFARARLSEFTDHGPSHGLRVKSFATQLSYVMDLSTRERHLLRAGALFHDIGNVVDRERHNVISQETVIKLTKEGDLPFTQAEAEIVGQLCRWHRREYDPTRVDRIHNERIRTGLLASILRVADAMDIDHRRSDYREKFREVLEFFFPDAMPHWTSLDEILGVRIHCDNRIDLEVFTKGEVVHNIQIEMLEGDLNSTPLDWTIDRINAEQVIPDYPESEEQIEAPVDRTALLVLPFEVHSLVTAGISRKHLSKAGYDVEVLCYPDTPDGSRWLWKEMLPDVSTVDLDRILIIGDRPDASVYTPIRRMIKRWHAAGVDISILNRHEANWFRIPEFLKAGVEVILGGDWAYFWGKSADSTSLTWGRIASLCTRDPTQSTEGVTDRERAITHGLLKVVYDVIADPPPDDTLRWSELAEQVIDRIESDDQDYFAKQANDFFETYIEPAAHGRVEGRMVVFDREPVEIPQAFYWIMEAAIERHGRTPDRGFQYNVPYSIATWSDGEVGELLAISHWREEVAIPIRLLYPTEIGPTPRGNESTIRARMSANRMGMVVQALVNACNTA